jgi:UDP-N-acetylmuramyl pentapeptide phosphotransferase/UDP-N-acetylglucosamine-1-phosphate transferase
VDDGQTMTTIGLWCAWCLAALVAAALLTRGLITWTVARGIIDAPNARSSHTRSTPRGGGLSIVIVVAVVAGVVGVFRPEEWLRIGGAIVPALAIAAVSWLDDVQSLRNRTRFAVHLAAAIAATAALGAVTRVDLGSLGMLRFGPLAWPLTVLWIVGLANAFNFMDGSDGIAGITAAAVAAGIAVAAASCGAGAVAVIAAAFAGASLGFLTSNWQPARIFMGDVGSAFCGFLLAVLPLAVRADAVPEVLPVAALALWPFIFDTSLTLLRRLRAGENIFEAHRSHLYQRLLIAGWSHRAVASLYGGLAAFGATIAATPLLDPMVRRAADRVAAVTPLVVAILLVALVMVAERRVSRVAA